MTYFLYMISLSKPSSSLPWSPFLSSRSLTRDKLKQAQKAFASANKSPKHAASGASPKPGRDRGVEASFRKLPRLATTPFESLEVFLPRDTKDYSLFLIGCICVVQSLAEVSLWPWFDLGFSPKKIKSQNYSRYTFQYLQRVLGWDSQDVSEILSKLVGV